MRVCSRTSATRRDPKSCQNFQRIFSRRKPSKAPFSRNRIAMASEGPSASLAQQPESIESIDFANSGSSMPSDRNCSSLANSSTFPESAKIDDRTYDTDDDADILMDLRRETGPSKPRPVRSGHCTYDRRAGFRVSRVKQASVAELRRLFSRGTRRSRQRHEATSEWLVAQLRFFGILIRGHGYKVPAGHNVVPRIQERKGKLST